MANPKRAVYAPGDDDDVTLEELSPVVSGAGGGPSTASELPFVPAGTVAATDVQAAIEEVAGEAGVGGVSVLEDPGVAWQADHVYEVGDRFRETLEGEVRVFEITVAGTSGAGVFSDYGADLVPGPDNTWGSGSETWIYLGIVGQLSWTVTPFLGGGLSVGPIEDTGHPLIYTTQGAPEDSESMVNIGATVAGAPVSVFQAKTDGDADWYLDLNTGAGFRWNIVEDGAVVAGAGRTQITTEGVVITFPTVGTFAVTYDPWTIRVEGLPTADPVLAGHLWNDNGTMKISAGA